MGLTILQWNTESSKQALEVLLEEAKFDLLAIQEPWLNPHTKSTYCPRSSQYHLVYQLEGRAAIFVNKRLDISQWNYEASSDWCRVWFPDTEGGGLEVWSIYNPPTNKTLPRDLLERPRPTYPVILTGDFNLHHPLWDQFARYEPDSEALLQLAAYWDLDLVTPWGTVTREPQGAQRGRPSTLDLIWASGSIQYSYYGIEEKGKSDHYPQVIETYVLRPQLPQQPPGWNWRKIDKHRIQAEAALLPSASGLDDPSPLGLQTQIHTTDGLDRAFDWLVGELTRIAEASTPRRKANNGFQASWWTSEVQNMAREARQAERLFKETPTAYNRAQLNHGYKNLSRAVRTARTKAWRSTLQEATDNTTLLWKLERWARCKSFKPPEPPRLPALIGPTGLPTLTTHDQKATILTERFFPSPPADLSDVQDPDLLEPWEAKFEIDKTVTPEDIQEVLSRTSPWKAPGNDHLPAGLLKACGSTLYRVLAALSQRCFELGWFPRRLKEAIAIVLPKPGKSPADYQTPGGYRPISLLPTIGKVIEAVITKRVTEAAEAYDLLPDEQMGNREHRSTELAIRLVVAQVREARRQRATASLLQLDITGAFDRVNYIRLLTTLRDQGFPRWLVYWIRAWLTDRRATLLFDGQYAQESSIQAGVPQGSPLSPVLFILYIASLYKVLREKHPNISLVGFADDSNLLAFGKDPSTNCRQLEKAWATCLQWAKAHGMDFNPAKSELIHFNKGRTYWTNSLRLAHPTSLDYAEVKPKPYARFLGIWLDWRLSWRAHESKIAEKLKTQDFALSRIAAKTWGPGLIRAREVYTKCIRSAIAYGATNYHLPTTARGQPRGLAKRLAKAQSRSLRIVAGAYKATPMRNLETETWVPPLDLYLNKRLADFETRLQTPVLQAGQGPEAPRRLPSSLVQEACNRLYRRFQGRRRPGRRPPFPQEPTVTEKAAITIDQWVSQSIQDQALEGLQDEPTADKALIWAWENRWRRQIDGQPTRLADKDPPSLLFTNKSLRKHQDLTKAQSSLLIQARTGAIGLRDFLFKRQVPGFPTPYCSCGEGRETVEHLVVWCLTPPKPRTWLRTEIRTHRDLSLVLQGRGPRNRWLLRKVLGWLMDSGRLLEYGLARKLELEAEEDDGDEEAAEAEVEG